MRTILVASDAPSVRAEVIAAVGGPDAEIVEVHSGHKVGAAVAEHEPDLVVVDLQMGNMGGMAVCLDLRLEESYGKLPHVPVLMLLDRRPDVFMARRSGAEGWVVKPLDPLRLRRSAEALLAGNTFHDESYQPVSSVAAVPSAVPPSSAALEPRPRVFRRRSKSDEPPPAERSVLTSDQATGEEQERRILLALDDLRDATIREVMTPRVDVAGLAIPVHAADVARAVRESGHSCFPVFDDDLDNLVGVLFVNDLFRAGWQLDAGNGERSPAPARTTELDISRRLRQPYLVPESRLVLDVLADMRRDRRAFAVVVDEYGGVAGIVTTRDLLGALVGDLRDELDPAGEPEVIRVDRTRWLVDGGTSIDDVRDRIGIDLPEGEYVTLGGYLFDALGHIPEEGERFLRDGWELRVVEMDRRRVAKVVVQGMGAETGDADPAS